MFNFMNKNYFKLEGKVCEVGELVHIEEKVFRPLQRVLTIETADGQKLYPELRNQKLKLLDREQIDINSLVSIEYSFEGSEKNGKRYNNIYINSIKTI